MQAKFQNWILHEEKEALKKARKKAFDG